MSRRAPMPLWPAGLAAAGAVAGHVIGFALAIPDPHRRADALRATGHGEFGHIAVAALLMAGGAFAVLAARQYRRAQAGGAIAVPRLASLTAAIATVQLSAFTICEALERVSAHEPLSRLTHEPAFLAGLAVQPLVAFGVAIVTRALHHVVRAFAQRSRDGDDRVRRSAALLAAPQPARRIPAPSPVAGAAGVRGPPRAVPAT